MGSREGTEGPPLVYIAGYGRSGSTVLSTVLGSHAQIISAGELGFGPSDWAVTGRECSCGSSYHECPFWSDLVGQPFIHQGDRACRATESSAAFPRVLLGLASARRRQSYSDFNTAILNYVRERSQKPILVDSSKTSRGMATRPLALARWCGEPVYVLHLVRDGRATAQSILRKGSNWRLEGKTGAADSSAMRAVSGWVLANLFASSYRLLLGRHRYLRIRFEDFLASPGFVIEEIGRWLRVDLSDLKDQLADQTAFETGHVTGGNRVRFLSQLRLESPADQRADNDGWPGPATAIAGSLMNRALGYR